MLSSQGYRHTVYAFVPGLPAYTFVQGSRYTFVQGLPVIHFRPRVTAYYVCFRPRVTGTHFRPQVTAVLLSLNYTLAKASGSNQLWRDLQWDHIVLSTAILSRRTIHRNTIHVILSAYPQNNNIRREYVRGGDFPMSVRDVNPVLWPKFRSEAKIPKWWRSANELFVTPNSHVCPVASASANPASLTT